MTLKTQNWGKGVKNVLECVWTWMTTSLKYMNPMVTRNIKPKVDTQKLQRKKENNTNKKIIKTQGKKLKEEEKHWKDLQKQPKHK